MPRYPDGRYYNDRPPSPSRGYRQGSSVADLWVNQGRIGAEAALAQGDIWGQAIQGIGQTITGGIAQHQQAQQAQAQKEMAARREATATQLIASWDGKDPRELLNGLVSLKGPVEGERAARAVMDFHSLTGKRDEAEQAKARNVLEQASRLPFETFQDLLPGLQQKGPIFEQLLGLPPGTTAQLPPEEAYKALQEAFPRKTELTSVAPGASLVDPRNLQAGAQFTAPVAPKPPGVHSVGRDLVDDTGRLIHRAPETSREPREEPLIPVMGDDGQPVLMPRSQASGRRPASSREQGRPVTSADAGRLSELQTSLDDLSVLSETLSTNKSTGTSAKAGAMLWNPITEVTGIGVEAKQKQAVIDRVKQVIGKALEGGVLRKEDEVKYEKILPTIGDNAAVVKSKLEGLEKAIKLRREREIEAREDAGYDVSRFRSRDGAAPPTTPPRRPNPF